MSASTSNRREFLRLSLVGGGGVAAAALAACNAPPTSAPPASTAQAESATASAAATAPPLTADTFSLPDGLDPRNFVIHGLGPLTLETRRDRFGTSAITPASRFFVRNNLPLPPASIVQQPDDWQVEFAGFADARSVSVRELKTWAVESVATVLQCSGNGRQFFEHATSGSQWGVGAAGCAIWTGVPLRVVAEQLGGALDELPWLTSTGGEELPEGVERESVVVERSIPRAKALDDCLLAWEMNGEPIPLTHGGPLRLIAPGYYGCNQIKYVKRVAFTAEQTSANIMRSGYRFRAIGESGAPTQPSMWEMNVKSWIHHPSGIHPVQAGNVPVQGVAFSGGKGVSRVEVSADGGETWVDAPLVGPDLGPYAWRPFALNMTLPIGAHRLLSRAYDGEGNVQPELRVENHRGYGHNGWRDLGVAFDAVEGPVIIEEEPVENALLAVGPGPGEVELDAEAQLGRELFTADATPACGTCHTLKEADTLGAVGPNLNLLAPNEERIISAVTNGVGAMPEYGGQLTEEQIANIAHYVRRVLR